MNLAKKSSIVSLISQSHPISLQTAALIQAYHQHRTLFFLSSCASSLVTGFRPPFCKLINNALGAYLAGKFWFPVRLRLTVVLSRIGRADLDWPCALVSNIYLSQGRSQDFSRGWGGGSQRLLTRLSCRPPRHATPILTKDKSRWRKYFTKKQI